MVPTPLSAQRAERKVVRLQILVDSAPLDLTSYATTDLTAYFGTLGQAPLATYTIGSGITVITAAQGIVEIVFASAALDQSPGRYSWELWDRRSSAQRGLAAGAFAILDSLYSQVP